MPGAIWAQGAPSQTPAYLEQLLGWAKLTLPGQADECPGASARPTLGSTITAILLEFGDGTANFMLNTRCRPIGRGRDACTLAFATASEDEQASAGFSFIATQAGHRIDPKTIRCFRTP